MSSRQPDPKNARVGQAASQASNARPTQPAHQAPPAQQVRVADATEPAGANGPTGGCPTMQKLDEFLASNLGDAELEAIAAHVNVCEACRRQVTGEPQHAALADDLRFANKQYLETPPTVSMPLTRLNELLADYNIIREIGRGGMGIVYEALHLKLNRRVALKVLPTLLSVVRPDAIERFQREAELAARLKHTNIIAVHDFGDIEGTLFYTMELIEGRSLRDLLREIDDTGAIDVVIGGNERSAVSRQQAAISSKPEAVNTLREASFVKREAGEGGSTKYERRWEA